MRLHAVAAALGGVLISAFAHTTQPDFFTVPPLGVIAAVLAMRLRGSVLAYLWWNDGVRLVGAGRAALFMNLVPIFAMLIGVVLGRPLLLSQLVGGVLVLVLVLGGVWIATAQPAPRVAVLEKPCDQHS